MSSLTRITLIVMMLTLTACMHSELGSSLPMQEDESVIPASFALASDFPADIVIPDIEGMRSTAFIVSTSTPAGVIAVDIDADPMELSSDFEGLIDPDGAGIPAKLLIKSEDEAFLLTSLLIIYFDPTNGYIYQKVSALEEIEIGSGYTNSDGTAAAATIAPAYPGGIALVGNRLFISTANYTRTEQPAVAAPGTVQAFEISDHNSLSLVGNFVTSGYNPTGLASRNDFELIVTNSGVLSIVDAEGVPETPSSIDIVDPETLVIKATIPLGPVAASYHTMALTLDGSRGFIGSMAYGHVYEVDLINRQVLRGLDDPHVVTDGSDFITDVDLAVDNSFFFAASFETSTAYPFDLTEASVVRGDGLVVGYPAGVTPENPSGANTGAGPMAIRPGSRGTDYEGADLFVLTGYPGTLVPVETNAPAQEYTMPAVSTIEDEPPPPPEGNDGDRCQGFAQAVRSVTYGDGAGFGQLKFPDVVLGPPYGKGTTDEGSLHVLSLGMDGEIILDLGNCPAVDGPGDDFIVFENAFYIGHNPNAPFAELGTVAVSDDGVNFIEFDCHFEEKPYTGCAGWHQVYSHPDNGISPFDVDEAGGEAYDLEDLGLENTQYIRIRALTGGGGGGTAGFDLDAVAVVNGEIEN